ncbi:hypothetical protein GE09DRAFT_1059072 [Coniochaeta sp. 2T2.1]|nr:hypothetical protein GE09DRAFT_1059072 [Coniochaeta sp. 2T2.1]
MAVRSCLFPNNHSPGDSDIGPDWTPCDYLLAFLSQLSFNQPGQLGKTAPSESVLRNFNAAYTLRSCLLFNFHNHPPNGGDTGAGPTASNYPSPVSSHNLFQSAWSAWERFTNRRIKYAFYRKVFADDWGTAMRTHDLPLPVFEANSKGSDVIVKVGVFNVNCPPSAKALEDWEKKRAANPGAPMPATLPHRLAGMPVYVKCIVDPSPTG